MQTTALHLPLSVDEGELVRLPATWDEYLDLLDAADEQILPLPYNS